MRALAVLALALASSACGPTAWRRLPVDDYYQQTQPPTLHGPFSTAYRSRWWDRYWHMYVRPPSGAFAPSFYLTRWSNGTPALDVNAFGQVPDSPWFENRLGRFAFNAEDLRRGPDQLGPPAEGSLLVLSPNPDGASRGFVVQDTAGARWLIKFDNPRYPGLSSSAEIVVTKILWAAGYHVPENYLLELDLGRLRVSSATRARDDYNREVPFSAADLRVGLAPLHRERNGRVRAIFSRFVPGEVIGEFAYEGRRPQDPNDTIPHEHRRSLRGLWLFAAWVNSTDFMQHNTVDSFIAVRPQQRLGYVRHYLVDFGASLGSAVNQPKRPIHSFGYNWDWGWMLERFFTLGIVSPPWLGIPHSPYVAIGRFEAERFDPAGWRTTVPNPAFDQATLHDTYWAASILSEFSPELVRAAVATGRYGDSRAAQWLVDVLLARRRKLLRYAFSRVLALDRPVVRERFRVVLTDLEMQAGLLHCPGDCYRWQARWDRARRRDVVLGGGVRSMPVAELRPLVRAVREAHGAAFSAEPFITVTWERLTPNEPRPPLELHLRVTAEGLILAGLTRAVR